MVGYHPWGNYGEKKVPIDQRSDAVILDDLLCQREQLKSSIESATAERASLPRNEKADAHRLWQKIQSEQAALRKLAQPIAHYRSLVDRRAQHGAWASAVMILWGKEGLDACFAQMRQGKRVDVED